MKQKVKKPKSSKCMKDMNRIMEKWPYVLGNPVKLHSLKEMSVIARQEKTSFYPSKKYSWSLPNGHRTARRNQVGKIFPKDTSQNEKEQMEVLTKYLIMN